MKVEVYTLLQFYDCLVAGTGPTEIGASVQMWPLMIHIKNCP